MQYFHNDIKTENLVLSGTTLKLIDFQSLTPLRPRAGQRLHVEHATVVYQHRQPAAVGRGVHAAAEATALWACGVILTRLLAAQLSSDWVYAHQGLGSQTQLEEHLPEGHCLLRWKDPNGPRDLLEKIFAPERTPALVEILDHPWVEGGSDRICPIGHMPTLGAESFESDDWDTAMKAAMEAREILKETARRTLETLRPEGATESEDSQVAWIPLMCCMLMEGRPPPVKPVEEMINVAVSLSDGAFRLNGDRLRRCQSIGIGPGEMKEAFHEWHIVVASADDEEAEADGEGSHMLGVSSCVSNPQSLEPTPSTTPAHTAREPTPTTTPAHTVRNRLSVGSGGGLSDTPPTATGSTPIVRRASMWRAARSGLVVDRFYVQVRVKESLEEGEPSSVWWLRVKWVPPMMTGKRSSLASLAGLNRDVGSRFNDGYSTCSFVRLQQLLLEGRNEYAQRQEREQQEAMRLQSAQSTRPRVSGLGLKLPGIMGR